MHVVISTSGSCSLKPAFDDSIITTPGEEFGKNLEPPHFKMNEFI